MNRATKIVKALINNALKDTVLRAEFMMDGIGRSNQYIYLVSARTFYHQLATHIKIYKHCLSHDNLSDGIRKSMKNGAKNAEMFYHESILRLGADHEDDFVLCDMNRRACHYVTPKDFDFIGNELAEYQHRISLPNKIKELQTVENVNEIPFYDDQEKDVLLQVKEHVLTIDEIPLGVAVSLGKRYDEYAYGKLNDLSKRLTVSYKNNPKTNEVIK